MEYQKTKDTLHLMQLLGNKRIQPTLKYTQLVNFHGQDEYVCKAAKTADEAKSIIESGFEYVCDMENLKLFRKRKLKKYVDTVKAPPIGLERAEVSTQILFFRKQVAFHISALLTAFV